MSRANAIARGIKWARDATGGGGPGVEMLVGMIGSGKSTYARKRATHGAVIVCQDEIVRTVHPGRWYDPVTAKMYRAMEESLARIALDAGYRIVIDRTNLTHVARDRWVGFAQEHRVPIVAVCFPMVDPDEHARRRFEDDSRGLTLGEWERIAAEHAGQAKRATCLRVADYDKIVSVEDVTDASPDPFDCPAKPAYPPQIRLF